MAQLKDTSIEGALSLIDPTGDKFQIHMKKFNH